MNSSSSLDGTLVRAREVCKHYAMGAATIRAVDGVSLEVRRGEFVALLGSSGSGKSTLLNLIAGLDQATSGSIEVGGRDLARMSAQELALHRRSTVGMVFQAFNLIPSMTIEENVELPMRFAEVDRGERKQRAMEALERVGLGGRMKHRPVELSGGEQQRVSLARALANRPTLLLADEPTGNLDSRTGEEIMNLIADLNRRSGMTVLMVTHERALADRYARRAMHMQDGKLLGESAPHQGAAETPAQAVQS
jgi:putative ABC transport system ATP-binding protein